MLAKAITTWNAILIVQPMSAILISNHWTDNPKFPICSLWGILFSSAERLSLSHTENIPVNASYDDKEISSLMLKAYERQTQPGNPSTLQSFSVWLGSHLQKQIFKMTQPNGMKVCCFLIM